jgi:hypothetical protein
MKHSGPSNPQGIIVAGEAPESDEEHEEGEQRYSGGTGGPKQRRKEEAWPPGQRLQEELNSRMSKKNTTTKILKF